MPDGKHVSACGHSIHVDDTLLWPSIDSPFPRLGLIWSADCRIVAFEDKDAVEAYGRNRKHCNSATITVDGLAVRSRLLVEDAKLMS